jgi:hypothetical protein
VSSRAALLLACAVLAGGCRSVRRVPDASPAEAEKREQPDSPAEQGVKPEGGPRVPTSPEALLAPGAISEIQRELADRALLGAHTRGELDAPTSRALRSFQAQEGLAETGFPDRETLVRLGVDPEAAYGREGGGER